MIKTRNIFLILLNAFCWLSLPNTAQAQNIAHEVRYGSCWQIRLLEERLSESQVNVSEKEKETYKTQLKGNQATVQFVEKSLSEEELPKMLRNLAMIESGFNNASVSSANAIGVWQITPDHADTYGLAEEKIIDINESTRVAIATLKDLYAKYGNWIKVIAAYNCGSINVDKAIGRAHSNKYVDFYPFLPDETINHVNKFMSACVVTNELDELMTNFRGSKDSTRTKATHPKTATTSTDPTLMNIQITTDIDIETLIKSIGTTKKDFEQWNPNLSADLAKYGKATLYLPISYMGGYLSQKANILNKSTSKNKKRVKTRL